MSAARADIDASSLKGQIIGHVGDGKFHTAYLSDPNNPAHLKEAEEMADRLVERAWKVGGTASGEHGIGMAKLKFMRKEHGRAVDVMNRIKAALDPLGIMNPGNVGDNGSGRGRHGLNCRHPRACSEDDEKLCAKLLV